MPRGNLSPTSGINTGQGFRRTMAIRRGLRNWLLAKDADPSVRLRVLRDFLDRPGDDPEVVRAQKEIGRKGWAARILREQHPLGQWSTSGTSAVELYRPKYVATNWRLLVLSDMGLTKKHPGIAKGMDLLVRRRFLPSGELGRLGSEVCITGNAVRMLLRFGYTKHPHLKPAIDWLGRHQKKDGGGHCFRSATGTLDCWEDLAAFAGLPMRSRSPEGLRSSRCGAKIYRGGLLFRGVAKPYAPWIRLRHPVASS